jgi:pimeloyl-ACP methyl ester carboxylesterase
MHRIVRTARALGLIVSLALVVACSGQAPTTTAPAVAEPSAADTTLVADIKVTDGRSLHIVCLGPIDTGRPTVILEHGLGAEYGQWEAVLDGLSKTQRVCAYDRSGRSRLSSLPTGPRTTADQVADLHEVLAGAGVKPPYILVGFSIGGWNNLVFAGQYPTEVAGAVFVDVRPPKASQEWLAALPPESPNDSQALKDNRFDLTVFEHDPERNPEKLDLAKSAQQAISAPGFGSKPLEILVRADASDLWEGLDAALAARLEKISDDLTLSLAAYSTNTKTVTVANTSHDIPDDQPQAIVDAILDVLAKAG